MIKSLVVDEKSKTVTVVLDLDPAHPSKTGRMSLFAQSDRGWQSVSTTFKGKSVAANVTVGYKNS